MAPPPVGPPPLYVTQTTVRTRPFAPAPSQPPSRLPRAATRPRARHPTGQTTPILFARGNHDAEHFRSYAYSALPAQGSWYAFLYGNTYFVVLNTEGGATGFHGSTFFPFTEIRTLCPA